MATTTIDDIKAQIRALAIRGKELQDESDQIHKQAATLKAKGYALIVKSMIGQTVIFEDRYCRMLRAPRLASVPATIKSVRRKTADLDFANGEQWQLNIADVLFYTEQPQDAGAAELDLSTVYKAMFPRSK